MNRSDPTWQYFPPELSENREDVGNNVRMAAAAPTNEFSDELSRLMGFDCSHILPGMQFNLSTDRWEYPLNPQPTFAPVGDAEINRMFCQPPPSMSPQNSPDFHDTSSIHSLDGPFPRASSSLSLNSPGDMPDLPGPLFPDYEGLNSVLETLLPSTEENLNFNFFEDNSRPQQSSDYSASDADIPVRGNAVIQRSHTADSGEAEDDEEDFPASSPRFGSPESFAAAITAPENFCWIYGHSDEQDDDSI